MTTPFTSSDGWSAGLPVASRTLPKDGKRVPETNTRWGSETRAELKSCITEHTQHPGRTRNHWCLPPPHLYKPSTTLRGWPPDSSGATATSSVEGLNRSYRTPDNRCQAALLNPGRHRTQHLPRPCHLGRLTHVCPHRSVYLSSRRVAPPLGNQSQSGVRWPTSVITFLMNRNQSPRSISS